MRRLYKECRRVLNRLLDCYKSLPKLIYFTKYGHYDLLDIGVN